MLPIILALVSLVLFCVLAAVVVLAWGVVAPRAVCRGRRSSFDVGAVIDGGRMLGGLRSDWDAKLRRAEAFRQTMDRDHAVGMEEWNASLAERTAKLNERTAPADSKPNLDLGGGWSSCRN